MSPRIWIPFLLALGLIGTGCSAIVGPTASVCGGVDAQLGGCDEEQPEFTATDCAGAGREFGALLDERTLAIIEGPEAIGGEARSVRLRQAMVLVSARANDHLREQGIHADCDMPEFLEAAEGEFSAALRDGVGIALYDGAPPATYAEWRSELTLMLGIIDAEETDG